MRTEPDFRDEYYSESDYDYFAQRAEQRDQISAIEQQKDADRRAGYASLYEDWFVDDDWDER